MCRDKNKNINYKKYDTDSNDNYVRITVWLYAIHFTRGPLYFNLSMDK